MDTKPFKLPKNVSPFGIAALALDVEFVEFERLATELERVPLSTDKGMERAATLMTHIDDCRARLTSSMQAMATALDVARGCSEKAATMVAERAALVNNRHSTAEHLINRFKTLGEAVKKVTAAVGSLRAASGQGGLSEAERSMLVEQWPALNEQLGILVDEAHKLMADAHAANMKTLEGNADSLRQSLQAARAKLGSFVSTQESTAPAPTTH